MIVHEAKSTIKWDIKVHPWSLVTLTINSNDIDDLTISLLNKLSQAPKFFHQTPIIISFGNEIDSIEIDMVSKILEILHRYKLKVVAFYGKDEWAPAIAEFFETPLLTKCLPIDQKIETEFVTTPLRAGMQFFSHGDIVALNSVNPGSELISQGNIHCYFRAQGRLIAGVNGNTEAKIFCDDFSAELVSIAGVFITRAQVNPDYLHQKCLITLEESKLKFKVMTKDFKNE